MCLIGNMELLCMQCMGIGPRLLKRGKSHGYLQIAVGTGVYSRVMAGMAIQNTCLFINIRTPVYLCWIPQESKLGLAGQYGCFKSEVWDQGSLSSWHSDIGIANNIQELSGIVNF